LRRFSKQSQRAIQVRFPAAVRTRDEIEAIERDDEIAERTVTEQGECRQQRERLDILVELTPAVNETRFSTPTREVAGDRRVEAPR
jgi:hypothetical protein